MSSRLADLQQFVGGAEGVGQHGVIRHHLVRALRVAVHHEAAADGVVAPFPQHRAGVVQCPEGHAVGVGGKGFAAMEHHVLVPVEINPVGPADVQLGVQRRGRHLVVGGEGVHGFRFKALQPKDHRLVGAVAPAGGAEGAEEL